LGIAEANFASTCFTISTISMLVELTCLWAI